MATQPVQPTPNEGSGGSLSTQEVLNRVFDAIGNALRVDTELTLSGNIIANLDGAALSVITPLPATKVVISDTSTQIAAANPNRAYLSISNIKNPGARISIGLGEPASLDAGAGFLNGSTYIYDGSGVPRGAVNLVSSISGIEVGVQEANSS
jgi:hypothetical protein